MPTSFIAILAIACGGALGAVTRYLILLITKQVLANDFPFATFFANFLGSALLGVIFVLFVDRHFVNETWRLLLVVGFTGSLTTFSTFSLETLQLLQKTNYLLAFSNILLNFSLTIFAVILAIFLTRLVFSVVQ